MVISHSPVLKGIDFNTGHILIFSRGRKTKWKFPAVAHHGAEEFKSNDSHGMSLLLVLVAATAAEYGCWICASPSFFLNIQTCSMAPVSLCVWWLAHSTSSTPCLFHPVTEKQGFWVLVFGGGLQRTEPAVSILPAGKGRSGRRCGGKSGSHPPCLALHGSFLVPYSPYGEYSKHGMGDSFL